MAGYVEGVGEVVDIAVNDGLLDKEFWIAVIDISGSGLAHPVQSCMST